MNAIIKTDTLITFCGGCNNSVNLKKFVAVDENQTFEEAWGMRHENEGDEVYRRVRVMGFCLCGNIYILQ